MTIAAKDADIEQVRQMRELAGRLLAAADEHKAGFPELMEKMRKVAADLLDEAAAFETAGRKRQSR